MQNAKCSLRRVCARLGFWQDARKTAGRADLPQKGAEGAKKKNCDFSCLDSICQ
jgi:hypothetical protein